MNLGIGTPDSSGILGHRLTRGRMNPAFQADV